MTGSKPVEQPITFAQVDSVTHDGVVIAFGEEWSRTPSERKLWYRVLDLQQTADQDLETAWEDATRWTRWYEVPWPQELRAVGMSLFDVEKTVDHRYASVAGRWKALDDGEHLYVFRALDLTTNTEVEQPEDFEATSATRVYATRYRVMRLASPDGGSNRGAKGDEVTVPQLVPVREARYRRSAVREAPLGDTDSQGTRDLGNVAFTEPTMEWSMLRPLHGAFTVTLTPSNLPGRMRWQFFCHGERATDGGGMEPTVESYSILRDDDGWADLEDKFNLLNADAEDRFRIRADAAFSIVHRAPGETEPRLLEMVGRPASVTFRLQEQSSPLGGDQDAQEEGRALSGQRVMLLMRARAATLPAGAKRADEPSRLAVIDFGLDEFGAVDISGAGAGAASVEITDVDFARTALWLNSTDDRVLLSDGEEQDGAAFSIQAWLRHDQGSGTIISRGWEPGTDVGGWSDDATSSTGADSAAAAGWAVEWNAGKRVLAGVRVLGPEGSRKAFRVEAALPGSFTWHHVALVATDSTLALFVDGVEHASTEVDLADAGGAVEGDVVIGGPVSGAAGPGWVDFRIDQVVLTQSETAPSLDTIYVELDEAARDSADTLGYWTFDRPIGGDGVGYALHGADEVSQTAPLFSPERARFEEFLRGMSSGMGLITLDDWEITADPNLFIGADGIVRLYLAATKDRLASTAGELVYDTTSARAQFEVPWRAAGEQSERTGTLILQAREPGPIMNRAVVEIEDAGDTLNLRVSHPYREDTFGEEWRNLPKALTDLVAVLNGRARGRSAGQGPPDEEETVGPTPPSYDYRDGPNDSSEPYASKVVQAVLIGAPDNGVDAEVQASTASLRQQGNFTGWTRAPLMVSGRFDDVVATADLAADSSDRLQVPGDFATEVWIDPGVGSGRERILNWHQGDGDGFALATRRHRQFALPGDDPAFASHDLVAGPGRNWFSADGGFQITANIGLPEGGGEGDRRAVATLATETPVSIDVNSFTATLKALREDQIADMSGKVKEDAEEELASWNPSTDAIAATYRFTVRLWMRGKQVECSALAELDGSGLDKDDQKMIDDWRDWMSGKQVGPGAFDWGLQTEGDPGIFDEHDLLAVPIYRDDGEAVSIVVTLDDAVGPSVLPDVSNVRKAHRPRVTCEIDSVPAPVVEADEDVPWLVPVATPSTGTLSVGTGGDETLEPFTGPIHRLSTAAGEDGASTFAFDFGDSTATAALPEAFFAGALVFEPHLGKRRYETRAIHPENWAHVGVVSWNNFAARFEQDDDRAVIRDASGLSPDREFTIDCVILRERAGSGAVFAKAIEIADDRALCFRLSIDSSGFALLKYSVEIDGVTQLHEVRSAAPLTVGRPYHVIASVKLEEVYFPDKPGKEEPKKQDDGSYTDQRWQYWVLHDAVWVYDIVDAGWLGRDEPTEFTAVPVQVHLAWAADFLATLGWTGWPLLIAALIPGIEYKVLSRQKDVDAIYDAQITPVNGPGAIGAATGEDPNRLSPERMDWFRGLIGSVRMWRTSLPKASLDRLPLEAALPSGVASPIASWAFDENRGLHAADSVGGMTATLTREEQWITTRETARLTFYLNGRAIPLKPVKGGVPAEYYGDGDQFTVGGIVSGGTASEHFQGRIDEVRVWRDLRTGEEMLDSMHTRLGGNEDDLAGWWPTSAGIGDRIKDGSSTGANHLTVVGDVSGFWRRDAAPVGDDLPQVLHLLGGQVTTWTVTDLSAAPMAAEYGDVQTDASGRVTGVQKRALIVAEDTGWVTATGFKTGDLDLIYVGQAQSDPTLIGYIEGAPPIPSENLTRPYWLSATAYDAYDGRTSVTLRQAENITALYNAKYDRGFDMSVAAEFLFALDAKAVVGAGFAFGGFADAEVEVATLDMTIGPKATFDLGLGWQKEFETSIGTMRNTSNTLGLGGSWEDSSAIFNPQVGRRFVPDNVGYALVKSGVANVYAMRLRRNGAMLGLTMVPDPDIPEDFNVITFKMRSDYTKQGTLDGRVGLMTDPEWQQARPGRGSYFRPLEAANLEAQIDAYEAKLLAAYDSFDAGGYGRRSAGTHFSGDDPAQDPRHVVESRNVIPHDWQRNISKRNIVNTYVWTASGGFFAEEVGTTIVRSESSGGSYSFQGMAGLAFAGEFGVGFGVLAGASWDVSAMFGGHIQTTVMKTKTEGRDFGLDVSVDCEGLLERYIGSGSQLYSGVDEPGKVSSYRFKTFYLVPDKSHFEEFWSRVVDHDWLESDDLDAASLRQATANRNHVWRVLHRVTYVQRVPPTGDRPPPPPAKPTRTVVHEVPNWQNLKLALDVLRTGFASTGVEIGGLTRDEQLAVAADDLVRNQWSVISMWWATMVSAFDADPDSADGLVVAERRRRVFEYLKAYSDTGLLERDRRLYEGPTPELEGPEPEPEPTLPPLESLAAGALDAMHLFTFDNRSLGIDQKGGDFLEYTAPATIAHDDLPPGLGGRLLLPGPSAGREAGRAKISLSGDWGRVGTRTWEVCFRLTESGPAIVMAPSTWVREVQRPFLWIAVDNERRDGKLAIWPVGAPESVSLEGFDTETVDKLVYLAVGYTPPVEATAADEPPTPAGFELAWAVEGRAGVRRKSLPATEGDVAGGPMTIGGSGREHFGHDITRGSLEVLHLAVHDEVFEAEEIARRLRSIGLEP